MTSIKENSTNSLNRKLLTDCNLTYAVQLMGGRWKLLLLMRLEPGRQRFGELKKNIPNITERMLTLQLRELEADGLVTRHVFAEVPPRVEYELTPIGRELVPICGTLHAWGGRHRYQHTGTESTFSHENTPEIWSTP
ncbi:helix-turn-helix domain-containing protein [Hymenobacter sp. YC55]|uniref:winged helix-turn-helix transcriptional regulator n=1 Tax=Hymenobacter sp. YC55 TaxID=3034019 RepID=UPI0023F6E4D5|nr:helix-turn-helix domain-containing protein [Hymenobacter sp. YC55]MDF7813882.1 helix-turn-helix domain-containing protein [Hymenobacter sp. YC55]